MGPVYLLDLASQQSRWLGLRQSTIAGNMSNSTESDIRPPNELLSEKTMPSPMLSGFGSRPIWFWLSLLGLALTSIEWCLYQRRVIS